MEVLESILMKNFDEHLKIGAQSWGRGEGGDVGWGLLWVTFIPSTKCMSLKFTGELCVMKMKKDEKIEKELTSSKLTWAI